MGRVRRRHEQGQRRIERSRRLGDQIGEVAGRGGSARGRRHQPTGAAGVQRAGLGGFTELDALRSADTVIVAPTDTVRPVPRGVLSELPAAAARGARIVSRCSGAAVLAAGRLDGRRATTHWEECAALAAQHPRCR